MNNLNLDYLKKLNSLLSYKVNGAIKLYEGTSSFISEIDTNYDEITEVMKKLRKEHMLNDFIFLLSKLREHHFALELSPYVNSEENISHGAASDFKILQDRIKSRRRELFSILVKTNNEYNLYNEISQKQNVDKPL